MQTPFWLPLWQAANALLTVATDAAVVLPFMALVCLFMGRKSHREAMARAARLFVNTGIVTAVFGIVSIVGQAWVSLRLLPAASPVMEPAPLDFTAPAWRAPVTSFATWALGLVLLLLVRKIASPVFSTAAMETDEETGRKLDTKATIAAVLALVACAAFFSSMVLRNWPFLGLPDQMTEDAAFSILLKYNWRRVCAALMPAGAIVVLTYFLQLPGLSREQRKAARENREREVIPGTAEEVMPLTPVETATLRMGTAFGLAGAVFQLLDASFLAFSPEAGIGYGGYSSIMLFGPFLVTAGSLVCWAFLFAKPRRSQLLLALLPVLLILLRAVAGF